MKDTRDIAATTYSARPRFEGSNIGTWIGFKHVMYLAEEAVLEHLRERGLSPRRLYEDYGLCCEIVDSDWRILHAMHVDDLVRVQVQPANDTAQGELAHQLDMFVERDGETHKVAAGQVKVLFRRDNSGTFSGPPPASLAPFVHDEIRRAGSQTVAPTGFTASREPGYLDDPIAGQLVSAQDNAFVWRWRAPYFYCHFTERLQHSGYLRLMEEVVDLFLADRGISIRTMLDTRGWIPVVPRARVEMLGEALMEETIYTVYTVEEIFKRLTYTARMDCYVPRNGKAVRMATGRIVHGYARIISPSEWKLVPFDDATMAALHG